MFGRKYEELKDDITRLYEITKRLSKNNDDVREDIFKIKNKLEYINIDVRLDSDNRWDIYLIDKNGQRTRIDIKEYNYDYMKYQIHETSSKDQYYVCFKYTIDNIFKTNWYLIKEGKSLFLDDIPKEIDDNKWIELE